MKIQKRSKAARKWDKQNVPLSEANSTHNVKYCSSDSPAPSVTNRLVVTVPSVVLGND